MAEDSQDLSALTAKIAENAGKQTKNQKEMVNELHMIRTKDDGVNKLAEKEEKREAISRDNQKIEGIRSLLDPLLAIADSLKKISIANKDSGLMDTLTAAAGGGILARMFPSIFGLKKKKDVGKGVDGKNVVGKGDKKPGFLTKMKTWFKNPLLKGGMLFPLVTNLRSVMKLFLRGGIVGLIATALYGVAQMADKDGSRMTETTDKLKVSMGKIRKELEPIWLSLKEGAEDLWKKIKHFFTRVGEIFEKLAPILGTTVLDMVDILGPTLVDMASGIADIVDGIMNMDIKKVKSGLNELMVGKDGNGGLINGIFGIAWKAIQGLSEGLIGVKLPDFPGFERLIEGIKVALWKWAGENNLRWFIPGFLKPESEMNREYVENLNKMSSLDQEIYVANEPVGHLTPLDKKENAEDIAAGIAPRHYSRKAKLRWKEKQELLVRNEDLEKESQRGMFVGSVRKSMTPKQSMVKQLELSKDPNKLMEGPASDLADATRANLEKKGGGVVAPVVYAPTTVSTDNSNINVNSGQSGNQSYDYARIKEQYRLAEAR
jgi:hypothetical protein